MDDSCGYFDSTFSSTGWRRRNTSSRIEAMQVEYTVDEACGSPSVGPA
jgi:hypothetical protein